MAKVVQIVVTYEVRTEVEVSDEDEALLKGEDGEAKEAVATRIVGGIQAGRYDSEWSSTVVYDDSGEELFSEFA